MRKFRYDQNQTPYNFTVEVTDRVKGLNLIECLKDGGWSHCTGGSDQYCPQQKESQNGQMVV